MVRAKVGKLLGGCTSSALGGHAIEVFSVTYLSLGQNQSQECQFYFKNILDEAVRIINKSRPRVHRFFMFYVGIVANLHCILKYENHLWDCFEFWAECKIFSKYQFHLKSMTNYNYSILVISGSHFLENEHLSLSL